MPVGVVNQPVFQVEWVQRETLHANSYNPNHVAPPELELLKISILEDGWTQPIVVRRDDREIVDGFHRWGVSGDKAVNAMTGGLVPVVFLDAVAGDMGHQMMSTIRHNRARGSHYVMRMADIVGDLLASGLTPEDLIKRLGMEEEEVTRLHERGNMRARGSQADFTNGWVPKGDD